VFRGTFVRMVSRVLLFVSCSYLDRVFIFTLDKFFIQYNLYQITFLTNILTDWGADIFVHVRLWPFRYCKSSIKSFSRFINEG